MEAIAGKTYFTESDYADFLACKRKAALGRSKKEKVDHPHFRKKIWGVESAAQIDLALLNFELGGKNIRDCSQGSTDERLRETTKAINDHADIVARPLIIGDDNLVSPAFLIRAPHSDGKGNRYVAVVVRQPGPTRPAAEELTNVIGMAAARALNDFTKFSVRSQFFILEPEGDLTHRTFKQLPENISPQYYSSKFWTKQPEELLPKLSLHCADCGFSHDCSLASAPTRDMFLLLGIDPNSWPQIRPHLNIENLQSEIQKGNAHVSRSIGSEIAHRARAARRFSNSRIATLGVADEFELPDPRPKDFFIATSAGKSANIAAAIAISRDGTRDYSLIADRHPDPNAHPFMRREILREIDDGAHIFYLGGRTTEKVIHQLLARSQASRVKVDRASIDVDKTVSDFTFWTPDPGSTPRRIAELTGLNTIMRDFENIGAISTRQFISPTDKTIRSIRAKIRNALVATQAGLEVLRGISNGENIDVRGWEIERVNLFGVR